MEHPQPLGNNHERARKRTPSSTTFVPSVLLLSPSDFPQPTAATPTQNTGGLRGSIRGSIRSLRGSLRRHKNDTALPIIQTVPLQRAGTPLQAPSIKTPYQAVLSGATTAFDDPKSGAPTVASTVASTRLFHTPGTGGSALGLSAVVTHNSSRRGAKVENGPYSGETAKSAVAPKDNSVTNSSRTQSPAFSGNQESMYSPYSSAVLSGFEKPVVFHDPEKPNSEINATIDPQLLAAVSPKVSLLTQSPRPTALQDMQQPPQELVASPRSSAILKSAPLQHDYPGNSENTDPDLTEIILDSGSIEPVINSVPPPTGEDDEEEFGIANLLFMDGSDEFDYTLNTFPKISTMTKEDMQNNLTPIVEVDSTAAVTALEGDRLIVLPSPSDMPAYPLPVQRSLSHVSNVDIVHNIAIESASGAASISTIGAPPITPKDRALMEERRSQCLQELILSEESYLSSLRMLANMYFATIESCNALGKEAVALLENDTRSLIEFHQELLDDIQLEYPNITISNKPAAPTLQVKITPAVNDFSRAVWTSLKDVPPSNFEKLGYRDGKWVKPAFTTLSPQFAARISQLVADKAISLYLYEQYCINYDATIELLRSYRDTGRNERFWVKGCENLLNAAQHDGRRKDLSLQSLMIIPAARISKYKLLLEQLAKNTCPVEETESHAVILDSLEKVEDKLMQIDHNHLVERFRRQSHILWNSLYFKNELPFSVQYFGLAILCGALNITWMGPDGSIKFYYMGCFLFKSYLILANVTNPEGRFYVKFVIPLHCCRIENPINSVVGLQTSSPLTKKLIFEHDFGLYEILLTATTVEELKAWHEKLEVQILSINGVYMWDFKASDMSLQGYNSASQIPSMKPLSVAFQKRSRWRNFFGSYKSGFSDPLALQLRVQHFYVDGDLESNYGAHTAATRDENDGVKCETIHIRRYARLEAEKALGVIWSMDELPLIPSRNADETYQPIYNVRNMVRRVASMRSTLGRSGTRAGQRNSGSGRGVFGGNRSRSLPHDNVSAKDYLGRYDLSSGTEEFFDALSHARSVWANTPHDDMARSSRFPNFRLAGERLRRLKTKVWKHHN